MAHRDDRRHAHHTTPHHNPAASSNPDYKTIPTQGESTSYYNPANTFPDEPPQKPTTSYQSQEEPDSSPHPFPAALHHASLQNTSTPSSLFTTALHHLAKVQKTATHSPIDEASYIQAHQAVYNANSNGTNQQQAPHTTPCIGMAAAMNALKTFTSGGDAEGNSQGAFIGHAMAQAGKLFDEQDSAGNVVSGYNNSHYFLSSSGGLLMLRQAPSANKQDAINQAAHMAYKLYSKSGSGGGGGPGGLLGKLL